MKTNSEKNTAASIHLSAFTQYFFPFGNFIFPIIIMWASKKKESEFVDYNGKNLLNFQLSVLLYSLVLLAVMVVVVLGFVFNNIPLEVVMRQDVFSVSNLDLSQNITWITIGLVAVLLLACLKILEFFLLLYAAVKTSDGVRFKYPITVAFIK
ncbi:DUF4870 domain-containing protein [Flavobacterium crassostreae]|uniref:DUF4870 domain-containing protein n=1 Tax=Flavobacterium crassostreae TaxID=1763534 RepID=A0A1B9E402_9FLAO|nr:DUF4870 domain-containing protein [Flavobacterium crassostreae]OCB76661.1 hypothetical protein LPBF_05895 [Flavobacterium crassostreae]